MRVGCFITFTDPVRRGDLFQESLACYNDLFDEIVIVNGGNELGLSNNKVKVITSEWPQEFTWPLIGNQFQKGYEASTTDWTVHCDADFLFHQNDFDAIERAMESRPDAPALSFWKWQFIQPDRYNLKSRLVVAVNKKRYGNRIKFDSGGDFCQPSLDGKEIKPDFVAEARVPIYNYEKILKTSDQIMDDCGRMARAWDRHFHDKKLGFDNESAFDEWMRMMKGRFTKPQEHIKLSAHPKYIQKTIENLTPEQFGYNGFGLFGDSDYMRELARC